MCDCGGGSGAAKRGGAAGAANPGRCDGTVLLDDGLTPQCAAGLGPELMAATVGTGASVGAGAGAGMAAGTDTGVLRDKLLTALL